MIKSVNWRRKVKQRLRIKLSKSLERKIQEKGKKGPTYSENNEATTNNTLHM